MKKLVSQLWKLSFSGTARNTYMLFAGNFLDAVLAFVFTVLAFKILTTNDFGIFSALSNFVIVTYSLLDIGISGSLINFVSYYRSKNQENTAKKYFQSGLFLRAVVSAVISVIIISFAKTLGSKFFLTTETSAVVLAGLAILAMSFLDFFYYSFQAYQQFLYSAVTSVSYSLLRVILILLLVQNQGSISLTTIMAIILLSPLLGIAIGVTKLKSSFTLALPDGMIIKKLLSFGGWVGVTRIFSTITGRMDVQMVLLLMTPSDAGVYSVATRIASFYSVVVTSFTAVLAPKFAIGKPLSESKAFIGKSLLVVVALVVAMIFGVVIAKPFIVLLFGVKAVASVLPFQALTLAFIPFVASTLATTIIIYNLKQPKVLAIFTVIQFGLVLVGNLYFIPRFGSVGPALTLGLTNIIVLLASLVWVWRNWK